MNFRDALFVGRCSAFASVCVQSIKPLECVLYYREASSMIVSVKFMPLSVGVVLKSKLVCLSLFVYCTTVRLSIFLNYLTNYPPVSILTSSV